MYVEVWSFGQEPNHVWILTRPWMNKINRNIITNLDIFVDLASGDCMSGIVAFLICFWNAIAFICKWSIWIWVWMFLSRTYDTQLRSTRSCLHLCHIGRLDGKDLLVTAPIGSVLHSFGMPSPSTSGLVTILMFLNPRSRRCCLRRLLWKFLPRHF
jgi:hypothetical protein